MLNAAQTLASMSSIEGIGWMTEHGSSLILNWGEDTNAWEVTWISGGERFFGDGSNLRAALIDACVKLDAKEREHGQ